VQVFKPMGEISI